MDNEIVIIGEKCDMWWDQNNFKLKKSFSSTMLNNLRNIVMGWVYSPQIPPPQIVINNIIYIFCGKLECFENK
jgi:hypothetical protein